MKCKACIFTCKTFREMAGCQGVFCIVRDAARKALNLPVCEQSSGCSLGNHYSGAFAGVKKDICGRAAAIQGALQKVLCWASYADCSHQAGITWGH